MDQYIKDYNTKREKLILSEFGRGIQEMVREACRIENREQRTAAAHVIARTMMNLNPELKAGTDGVQQKIWDSINIMSGFKLDIDFPVETVRQENVNPKPERVPYTQGRIRERHYGKNIERLINAVADMEGGSEKDRAIYRLALHMKKLMMLHNRERIDDALILQDLNDYSGGRIKVDTENYQLCEFVDMTPAQPAAAGKKKKKKKK